MGADQIWILIHVETEVGRGKEGQKKRGGEGFLVPSLLNLIAAFTLK